MAQNKQSWTTIVDSWKIFEYSEPSQNPQFFSCESTALPYKI